MLTSLINIPSVTTFLLCLGVCIPLLICPLALPHCKDLSKTYTGLHHHCNKGPPLQLMVHTANRVFPEADEDMTWACLVGPLCPQPGIPAMSNCLWLPMPLACLLQLPPVDWRPNSLPIFAQVSHQPRPPLWPSLPLCVLLHRL